MSVQREILFAVRHHMCYTEMQEAAQGSHRLTWEALLKPYAEMDC